MYTCMCVAIIDSCFVPWFLSSVDVCTSSGSLQNVIFSSCSARLDFHSYSSEPQTHWSDTMHVITY